MNKLSRWKHSGILILVTVAAARLGAQDTTHTRRDSLVSALKDLQARLDALEQKVSDATENGVHTRSGIRMELTGRVLVQGFGNSRRVNNVDDPQFVRPDSAADVSQRGGGMSVRQTLIAFRVSSPDVAGAQFAGDLQTDFFGGQMPSSGGRTFPLLRMRIAKGTLRWSHSELMVGQDVPIIAPINPTSVLASGTPDFAAAGNLWLWLPQARLTLGGMNPNTAALQLGVLAPTSGDPAASFDTDLDPAERSGRPYLQARGRYRWEMSGRPGEAGCGGHLGWLSLAGSATVPRTTVTSNALACDLVAPFGIFELRGEAYTGQRLRGLGGAAIGQGVTTAAPQMRNVGAWGQLNVAPSPIWSFGLGGGVDDPRDDDVPANGRIKNDAFALYFTTHPSGPLLLSAEWRRLLTKYQPGMKMADHFNLGFGFEF